MLDVNAPLNLGPGPVLPQGTNNSNILSSMPACPNGTGLPLYANQALIGPLAFAVLGPLLARASADAADPEYFDRTLGRERASRLGRTVDDGWNDRIRNIEAAKSCKQAFIDRNGKVGDWGRIARDEMLKVKGPNIYFQKEPFADAQDLCPNYGKFSAPEREAFWIGHFASLAQPESSCAPGAAGRGPNGTAMGLFQLEPTIPYAKRSKPKPIDIACPGMTAAKLYTSEENIRCAVRLFALEMQRRSSIMTPRRETYWGPLRKDHWNAARGGDIKGARIYESLMRKLPGCT